MKTNHIFIFLVVFLITSCSTPFDDFKDKTWEGNIIRMDDDKVLSPIKLKFYNDNLFIFSNAIYGADNDTLVFSDFNEKDSIFTYKNSSGDQFRFRYKYIKKDIEEKLYLIGEDYYISLKISASDLFSTNALDFYYNKSVPRNPYLYLDGAYEGEMEMENSFLDLAFSYYMGGLTVKFVFLDNFKVRIYMKNIVAEIFSDSKKSNSEIANYTYDGDKLLIYDKDIKKHETIMIKDNGKKLVWQTEKMNIVLYKKY